MSPTQPETDHDRETRIGLTCAVLGYLWWAVMTPSYFRILKDVPPLELLAWRVLAGLPVVLPLVYLQGQWPAFRRVFRSRRTLLLLVAGTALIVTNWLVFILSVVWERLSEASFGYYLNPLVSVMLGAVFLGERLRAVQMVAIALAACGCTVLAIGLGGIPWISLVLAFSFGFYGLVKKRAPVPAATGLAVEMTLLLPAMMGLGTFVALQPDSAVQSDSLPKLGLLLLGGVVTVTPLVLFATGARRLRLATIGMLQYIAPSGQLLLTYFVFGEELGPKKLIAFAFIWVAVLLYSGEAVWRARTSARRVLMNHEDTKRAK